MLKSDKLGNEESEAEELKAEKLKAGMLRNEKLKIANGILKAEK